jgi:hypothetical protein
MDDPDQFNKIYNSSIEISHSPFLSIILDERVDSNIAKPYRKYSEFPFTRQ